MDLPFHVKGEITVQWKSRYFCTIVQLFKAVLSQPCSEKPPFVGEERQCCYEVTWFLVGGVQWELSCSLWLTHHLLRCFYLVVAVHLVFNCSHRLCCVRCVNSFITCYLLSCTCDCVFSYQLNIPGGLIKKQKSRQTHWGKHRHNKNLFSYCRFNEMSWSSITYLWLIWPWRVILTLPLSQWQSSSCPRGRALHGHGDPGDQ